MVSGNEGLALGDEAAIHTTFANSSPNNRVNATVRPVTRRACARLAPVRPARYAVRWADDIEHDYQDW